MNKILKNLLVALSFVLVPVMSFAADLTSSASVNITSDTAMNAKIMAMGSARRQIITDALAPYVNKRQFDELLKSTNDNDLMNLISSVGIDSERLSTTTYSADIKMTLDTDAAQKWLDMGGVQNWLAKKDYVSADKLSVLIDVPSGLSSWIELNRIMRDSGVKFNVKKINNGQITIEVPSSQRTAFLTAIQNSGFKSYDNGEFIRVGK